MSFSNLPDDIQVEIFMKLPVNSILACKYLCKRWFTLLSNPKFIKDHLHLTRNSKDNNIRLMRSGARPGGESPVIGSRDYDSSIMSISPFSFTDHPIYTFGKEGFRNIRILGSCNGLFCLGIVSGNWNCYKIYIWNPSTKEYKQIPGGDVAKKITHWSHYRYGFGYDENMDDYKVVRIPYDDCAKCLHLQVYTLGSDSWHNVQTSPYYLHPQCHFSNLVFFNGALHWSGYTLQGTSSSDFIASFELSNETLLQLPFPVEENIIGDWEQERKYKTVGVLGDCLCLTFCYFSEPIEIWVMQEYGVRESWTKRFTITRFGVSRPVSCKPIWSFENGEILLDTLRELIVYEPESGKVRRVMRTYYGTRDLEFYVESLVSVKPNTSVEKRIKNRSKKRNNRKKNKKLYRTFCTWLRFRKSSRVRKRNTGF